MILVAAAGGCAAPFSDFQSARTVERGEVQLTPSYSAVQFRNDGGSEKTQDEFSETVSVVAAEDGEDGAYLHFGLGFSTLVGSSR